MDTWPSVLPQNPSSVTSSPKSQILETRMSTGYSKIRRRFTKTYHIYELSYEMTTEQFYDFEWFFKFVIGFGVQEFLLPDPLKITTNITCAFVQNENENPYSVQPIRGSDDLLITFSVEELET